MEFDRENLSIARLGRQVLFHCFDVLRFLTSLAFGAPMLVPNLGKAVCFIPRLGREISRHLALARPCAALGEPPLAP